MIVSERQAQAAWDTLRTWARAADEKWDADELVHVTGQNDGNLRDIYRTACRFTHPDMGGSVEDFAAVDRAKYVVEAWLAKRARVDEVNAHGAVTVCPRCNGDRRIKLQKGFRQMQVQCPTCHGNGELYDEKDKGADRL